MLNAEDERKVLAEIVNSLRDERDLLGYLASHAMGGMSDSSLDAVLEPLVHRTSPHPDIPLLDKTRLLVNLVGTRTDTSLVSAIFRVSFDEAETALRAVAAEISASV